MKRTENFVLADDVKTAVLDTEPLITPNFMAANIMFQNCPNNVYPVKICYIIPKPVLK